jgi:ubiquitin C
MATENIDNFKDKIQESNASGSGCFQVMIKTLNFGTITLDIEENNTIDIVKKMARLKLDDLTQGLDSELWISNETELICNGKLLEDGKTVSDYNIQKDATLRMVFGLDGGAKRGRSAAASSEDPNTSSGAAIMDMTDFTMEMKMGVEKTKFSYTEWVSGLSIDQHLELKDLMMEHQKYILADNTIRKYAPLVPIFGELEAWHLKYFTNNINNIYRILNDLCCIFIIIFL